MGPKKPEKDKNRQKNLKKGKRATQTQEIPKNTKNNCKRAKTNCKRVKPKTETVGKNQKNKQKKKEANIDVNNQK